MTYLFGTYNDMPLKQNPETITLQSCLCERIKCILFRKIIIDGSEFA
ncbi:hypothetical protein T11_2108 [Trichinella zimbabwensis]|uniref:Uncharacterized protein n=1 Tax=Trichinella zimbabwensis TaxID=268475 RepID=A0A0V1GCX8_9BILA|nr:hypothetical protein T11_2108 [Trichinella zimbabwensis]